MSKIINIFDVEFTEGQKISKQSPHVLYALERLGKRNRFKIEENEKVFDLAEVLLECVEIDLEQNKKRGNFNAGK